jgi:hypothetical protein
MTIVDKNILAILWYKSVLKQLIEIENLCLLK